MRVLWLTRFLPYPPFYGGDALYSSKLIEALAANGAAVHAICFAFEQEQTRMPNTRSTGADIRWTVLPLPSRPVWTTLFSALPSIAARFRSPAFDKALSETMTDGKWDAIVIDHIGMAGMLGRLSRTRRGDAVLVYLSHNHEASVRRLTAEEYSGNPIKRYALMREAAKVNRIEAKLVGAADIVTANTEEDAAQFRADNPGCKPVVVAPGYDGPVVRARTIDESTPRRATIVGSFGWIAKQMNLDAFLDAAAARFKAAGAEIEILGSMPDAYKEKIERTYPTVLVRGRYDNIAPYLAETRLGIVPEQTGGGFKHKVLFYAFGRVPVAALRGSVAGMPLTDGESILYATDMAALTETCLAALDDLDRLNRLQDLAFSTVENAFDWADRGSVLANAIRSRAGE